MCVCKHDIFKLNLSASRRKAPYLPFSAAFTLPYHCITEHLIPCASFLDPKRFDFCTLLELPGGSVVKNPPAHAGDMGSVPGSGRSSGEGNGNSLQYSWRILGEFHGERESLADYNPWGHKELDTTKQLTTIVVVQSPSRLQLFTTPWTAVRQASLFLIISQSLPKFMFIALVMLSSHFIL